MVKKEPYILKKTVGYLEVPIRKVSEVRKNLKNCGWLRGSGGIHAVANADVRVIELNVLASNVLSASLAGEGTTPHFIAEGLQDGTFRYIEPEESEGCHNTPLLQQPTLLEAADASGAVAPHPWPGDARLCSGLFSFRYVELFAGIGGFRVALDALGGTCVFASEIHETARSIYKKNFGTSPSGNVCDIPANDVPEHDLLTAGFPCQPFSRMGTQPGLAASEGHLFWQIVRVVRHRRPRMLLLENVPGLTTIEDGKILRRILLELSSLQYDVGHCSYDAVSLVPQRRGRIYIVGIRSDGASSRKFTFPCLPCLERSMSSVLEDVEAGDPKWTVGDNKMNSVSSTAHVLSDPSRVLDRPSGTLTARYKRQRVGAHSLHVPQAGHNPRHFTHREAARLMGFPDIFITESERKGDWYHCAGNAVVPPVIACLAASLLCHVQHEDTCRDCGLHAVLQLVVASTADRASLMKLSVSRAHCAPSSIADVLEEVASQRAVMFAPACEEQDMATITSDCERSKQESRKRRASEAAEQPPQKKTKIHGNSPVP